jgi:hypothetical protein
LKLVDIPTKFGIPFAGGASAPYVRVIPEASQPGGAASLTDGFPPPNFLAIGAGGIPPFGADMNGILRRITQWSRWAEAGGAMRYDSSFQTEIGGYPQGAVVMSAVTLGLMWLSIVDDNLTNPDDIFTSAGWQNAQAISKTRLISDSGSFLLLIDDSHVGLARIISPAASSTSLLPAMPDGYEVTIEDLYYNANFFPITIGLPFAHEINGSTNPYVIQEAGGSARFKYYGNDNGTYRWSVSAS